MKKQDNALQSLTFSHTIDYLGNFDELILVVMAIEERFLAEYLQENIIRHISIFWKHSEKESADDHILVA